MLLDLLQSMWHLLNELPVQVVGNSVFAFLSAGDFAKVERVLVVRAERDKLFSMVRSGPALDCDFWVSDVRTLYSWIKKNDLRIERVVVRDPERELSRFVEFEGNIVKLSVHAVKPLELHKYPSLCNKIDTFSLCSLCVLNLSPSTAPVKYLRQLRSLQTMDVCCTKGWVTELLNANPGLHSLKIIPTSEVLPSSWFDEVSERCGNIRELEFSSVRCLSEDSALRSIAQHFRSLQKLHIRYQLCTASASTLAEKGIISVARECQMLESVTLEMFTITPGTVAGLCLHLKNVTALIMPGATLSYCDAIHLLPQHRKQPITELECRWALQQESEVQACAALFSGLTTLKVAVPAQCERAFAAAAVPQLRDVRKLTITVEAEKGLLPAGVVLPAVSQSCRHLAELVIAGTTSCEEAVIAILERNRGLRQFWWNKCKLPMSDAVMIALGKHCPLLEELSCEGVSDVAVKVVAAGCAHLRFLSITSASITDAALLALSAHCHRVHHVQILHCPGVTETGYAALVASCSLLNTLYVRGVVLDAAAQQRIVRGHAGRSLSVRLGP